MSWKASMASQLMDFGDLSLAKGDQCLKERD